MKTILLSLVLGSISVQAANYKGLWLRVSDQVILPGESTQVQITLTEPKPIIRTRMFLEFDETMIEEITAFSIYSEDGDAVGTAMRMGNRIRIEAISRDGKLGDTEYLPLITMQVRLKSGLPTGSKGLIRILPESQFIKRNGETWEVEDNQAGVMEAGSSLAVDSVLPSGGLIESGAAVRVLGRGFVPWSKATVSGAPALKTTYVSPTELLLVGWQPYQLDQRQVRVENPDLTAASYFAFLKGQEVAASLYDLVAATHPLFSSAMKDKVEMELPVEHGQDGRFAAVAMQNPHDEPVLVSFEITEDGRLKAIGSLTLSPQERISRDVDELVSGFSLKAGWRIRFETSAPIQMLGLAGEPSTGTVLPVNITE